MRRISILGGGVGAISAAFELTSVPGWQERYSVTVYQLGWRLGGKGASGRGANGRIEEHGLHIWFSAYANAFDMMRRCYGELRNGPHTLTFDTAFQAQDILVLQEWINSTWRPWEFDFSTSDSELPPGSNQPDYFNPWIGLLNLLGWLHDRSKAASQSGVGLNHQPVHDAYTLAERIDTFDPTRHGLVGLTPFHGRIVHHLQASSADAHAILDRWEDLLDPRNDLERRLAIEIDLGSAVARGMIVDNVALRGLDALDSEDLRAWLQRHGAHPRSLDSALLRALYDLGFSYPNGQFPGAADKSVGSFAAGVGVRSITAIFAYARPLMWKLNAGMGDTIFTPLYLLLAQRGVKFKFFHRVTRLHPSADGKYIESVDLMRQAQLVSGHDDDYYPLVTIGGLDCWPSAPLVDQLRVDDRARAAELESAWGPTGEAVPPLRYGEDFDTLILGISLGALDAICVELARVPNKAGRRWRSMLTHVQTVRTQALQLWLRPTLAQLGWPTPTPLVGGFVQPLSTWADMSQLIGREAWPADDTPGSIAYFCGVMPDDPDQPPAFSDPEYPRTQAARLKRQAQEFVDGSLPFLWPASRNSGGFDWDLLVDPQERTGDQRLDAQFWRANIDPSERYVIAVPGTTQCRLPPDKSGFKNLLLVGDWTRTEINCGTVESAVLSARHAVRAIVGKRNVPIVGPFQQAGILERIAREVERVLHWGRSNDKCG